MNAPIKPGIAHGGHANVTLVDDVSHISLVPCSTHVRPTRIWQQ